MSVREHNEAVGKRWSAAGGEYEEISRQIADSIQHAVDRLAPKPGERILDLATGTGWTARLVAAAGAKVTGVDIAADKIEAARRLSDPAIEFGVDDAESLSFGDGAFDAVISTCGIQFVTRPEDAARELARVLRPGGRFAITVWTPDSTVAGMFKVFKQYMPTPADPSKAPPSPFLWGTRERLHELLGSAFELGIEAATSYYRAPSPEDAWRAFRYSYGPSKMLAESLSASDAAAMERDFIALYEAYRTELGVLCPRTYLLACGTKR